MRRLSLKREPLAELSAAELAGLHAGEEITGYRTTCVTGVNPLIDRIVYAVNSWECDATR